MNKAILPPTSERLFTAPEIAQWSPIWSDAKLLNSALSAIVSNMRAGRDSGLYVQPGTFHPLDPRMFAAHMWRPGYDKGPSRAFKMLKRDLGKEGKAHHRIVEPPADRKGKSKSPWSVPWDRKSASWSDTASRGHQGPTVWCERDGKRGACWGLTKAEMRRIADAIDGKLDHPRVPFQAYRTGCTAESFRKAVGRAEASGSCEPFEDALTNLWARKRRKRRPPRRVRVEEWCDHAHGDHGDHMTVATERGLREQTLVNGVEYGRSCCRPHERGLIHTSYWPNGLGEWMWDRQRWISADPDGARNWWEGDYLALRSAARLSVREGAILKMRSQDPPRAVSGIARFFRIDPKAVRTSEKIGLARLAKARAKVGELTPPLAVEHRLRPIATLYRQAECGELVRFWDANFYPAPSASGDLTLRRGGWRWRPVEPVQEDDAHSGVDFFDEDKTDPLSRAALAAHLARKPQLVPYATLLTRPNESIGEQFSSAGPTQRLLGKIGVSGSIRWWRAKNDPTPHVCHTI
jgi:hypothetical protein